jgi:hypothetical protein
MSPGRKTNSQIENILINRQRHSNILDVQSFRAADCDTDHYPMVENVGERLPENKQRSHRFSTEMFNLKKLNEREGKRNIMLRSQIGVVSPT